MKMIMFLLVGALLVGCAEKPPVVDKVLPTLPAKVVAVDVKWKVIADVREIEGKRYLVLPYDGNPYVALSYGDSLVFRSWMDDVKRKNDQTDNILCVVGYTEKCKGVK